MEVKSISECLNRFDNMIFGKILKCPVEGDLEDMRNHTEWKQAHVAARRECIEERLPVLSDLSQIYLHNRKILFG